MEGLTFTVVTTASWYLESLALRTVGWCTHVRYKAWESAWDRGGREGERSYLHSIHSSFLVLGISGSQDSWVMYTCQLMPSSLPPVFSLYHPVGKHKNVFRSMRWDVPLKQHHHCYDYRLSFRAQRLQKCLQLSKRQKQTRAEEIRNRYLKETGIIWNPTTWYLLYFLKREANGNINYQKTPCNLKECYLGTSSWKKALISSQL